MSSFNLRFPTKLHIWHHASTCFNQRHGRTIVSQESNRLKWILGSNRSFSVFLDLFYFLFLLWIIFYNSIFGYWLIIRIVLSILRVNLCSLATSKLWWQFTFCWLIILFRLLCLFHILFWTGWLFNSRILIWLWMTLCSGFISSLCSRVLFYIWIVWFIMG